MVQTNEYVYNTETTSGAVRELFEPIKILSPTCLLALSPNYMIRIATMKLTSSWFPVNLEHIWKIIGGPS